MKKTNPVFNTSSKNLESIWADFQKFQVEFAFRQELALYYQSPNWISSDTVLDAGCGNGYYLRLLNGFFPNKHFVGIDSSAEFINLAHQDNLPDNFKFLVSDFFDAEGKYDTIIMRLFLQHLQEPLRALDKAKTLLHPGGCVLIVDSIDDYRYYYPDVPKFKNLFQTYRNQQHEQHKNRDIASLISNFVKDNNDWQIQVEQDIIIPSTLKNNQELFLKVYTLFIDMVQAVGDIDYPFQEVRNEIAEWSAKGGYTQIGLKLLSIVRK